MELIHLNKSLELCSDSRTIRQQGKFIFKINGGLT